MKNLSDPLSFLKQRARRSKYLVLARAVFPGPLKKSVIGSTHQRFQLAQSVDYINRVFSDYCRYGNLTPAEIANKTILEIGPGDNLGVALKFIAAGAKRIVALDRFDCEKDNRQQLQITRAMLQAMTAQERILAKQAVVLGEIKPVFSPTHIRLITGRGIDEAGTLFEKGSFDIIVSRAVLQYVENLDAAFNVMHTLLKPGGRLIHKIDLRDHGIFSDGGMSDLEFLTVPDFIWGRISSRVGKINRARIDYYRSKMNRLGYDSQLFITHLMGRAGDLAPHPLVLKRGGDYTADDEKRIAEIRPRLLSRFKNIPTEDLLVSGIFLAARKPALN